MGIVSTKPSVIGNSRGGVVDALALLFLGTRSSVSSVRSRQGRQSNPGRHPSR